MNTVYCHESIIQIHLELCPARPESLNTGGLWDPVVWVKDWVFCV